MSVRMIWIACVVSVVALSSTTPAFGAYYIGKRVAEHYMRDLLHDTYGYRQTGVSCRPKEGRNETYAKNGRLLYHAWFCGFYARNYGSTCKGLISIKGSDGAGGFVYFRHWSRGPGC